MRTKPNDKPRLGKSVRRGRRREGAVAEARGTEPRAATSSDDGSAQDDEDRHQPERTCVLSRRKASREELIRLALGPDGNIAPDVRARAPGRGAWIGVTRTELDSAIAKGKLKAALQRAFKATSVGIPADLGERAEAALRQVVLDRLGMESRAGNLVTGSERIENAARAGKVRLLIHAADAGEDGRKRMDQAWRVGGGGPQGVIFPEGRTILSLALGRENVVHIALTDVAAASRVQHALVRWRSFTGPTSGPEGGEPALRTGSADED
ncbi:MAG TPA: DUF448 domain-containing protein [Sphingomicrobium sp.]|nr:DUF448 domain-containing protein [Sphingomicrobium sp.]